ncbi:hypothetical protein PCANC_00886 [Puccinia coronata f. sp. avenae]|uniref:Uncharacterized protein n=1 Tax=Puccinia coronata f. sp. avenae TaxID=200324 RepID=A0A2N5W7E3_9BASI|nr:hypothetical protein PCASD_03594 [Puccinia coronata f. sp. avenae]PLW58174.1 hypothetical protein PCANC_00886 [Puccinia coronata f. sp. avenae]
MSGPSSGKGFADNKGEINYLRLLMEAQHKSIVQAQQDQEASAERMTRFEEASAQRIAQLEDAIMFLSTQRDTTAGPLSTNTTAPVSACY